MPLELVVRQELALAARAREARRIVNDGQILVDGSICRDPRRGVGLMDVVSIPALDKHYRVLYDHHGRINLVPIPGSEAGWKLSRIEGKATLKKGRRQINFHDGRNLVLKEDPYKTGDVLRLKLPGQEVAEHFPFKEGAPVYVTGGTHAGELATFVSEEVTRSSGENIVTLETSEGKFRTVRSYAFTVGKTEPVVTLPEVSLDA